MDEWQFRREARRCAYQSRAEEFTETERRMFFGLSRFYEALAEPDEKDIRKRRPSPTGARLASEATAGGTGESGQAALSQRRNS